MIFKTIQDNVTGTTKSIGLLGKTFDEFKFAVKNIKQNGVSSIFSKSTIDISSVNAYNTAIKKAIRSGVTYTDRQQIMADAIKNTNMETARLINSTNGAIVKTESLTAAQQQSTLAAKAQSIALKVASTAANIIVFTAIIKGIELLGRGLDYLAHYEEKASEKADELYSKSSEKVQKNEEEKKSIEELINKYKKLKESENYDVDTRKEIKELQNDIANLVGSQASNLDLVNGKLDEEIAKLKEISAEEAKSSYRDAQANYRKAKDSSGSAIGEDSVFSTNYDYAGDVEAEVRKILKQNGFYSDDSVAYPGTYGVTNDGVLGSQLVVSTKGIDSVQGKIDYLESLLELLEKNGQTGSNFYTGVVEAVSHYNTYLQEETKAANSLVDSWITYSQYYNGELSKINVDSVESFEQYRQKMIDEAKKDDGIARLLADKTFSEDDVELAINDFMSTCTTFSTWYEQWKNDTFGSNANSSPALSFTDAISEVQSLSKGLNQLDKIYADVFDKEEFDWSSILNNEDFKTVFGELGDVYDNFISTVSNSPDDITACQNAFDDLSTAYIYNSGVLDDVTESTKTATIAMLEQLGIENATELVENAIAVQKQFLAETGIELANATYEEIAAFLAESDATDDTKQALAAYQLQKELAAGLTLDTSGDIENLQNLVKACGGATTALSTLNKIKSGNLSGVNMYGGKENRDALIRLAEQEVQDALNKVSSASSTATNKVKYGGGTSAKKAKESASKSANGSKDTSKTYNWVETAIERVERSLKKLSETASSVYKNWTNRNNALASEVTKTTEALNLQQSAYQTYMNEADKVGLSDTYQALIQNGGLRIEDITDEKLQQQIETYKDYYTKALSAADSVDELTKSLSELAKTKFDNVVSEFDDALSLIEHRADMLSASIDQTEKKGYIVSKNYYEALIISQTSNLTKLQEEYSALTSSFEEAMNTGRIEQYSEAWYDMASDINQVEKALTDARTSLIEYENSMRELNWSIFDKLQDYIGDITKETDFLSSLISDKKLYDDYGNFNDNGYSEMGLHGISYNTLMNQADKYGEELERINKELAEDPYNQILIDRQRELAEAQRNVVSSAMDEKDAIINLIKEAYDAQLDSLQKIIDKKKDALNAAKDLYDYENSIAEQTKKVADYRKQLIAYSGDDSEESKALVQQLTTNLADAEKALQETEYNKWKSDQEQMLDTLYSDYESLINERMDNTDGLLQDAINVINEKSDIISDTVTTAANDVGIVLSEPLESILIENRGTKDLISLYGNDFTARWTTTNDAVNGITNKVADMINASNAQSQSIISAISTAANSIVSVRQAEIAAYTPPSPSTNNSGNSGSSGNSSNGSSSNNKGDSSGSSPSGNKGNSISSGKLYYVVDRDGYALSPGYKTLGEAMRNVSTYRGVDISSIYKKKLYPFDPFGGNMNLFANGGVVKPTSKTTGLDKIAQSFGEDHIVAVRNNERLLTPLQNNSFEALAKCAPDLIKSLTANNIPYLNLTPKNTILPSRQVSNQSVSVNIDAVQVNGVNDPQKFANELVSNLKSNTRVQNTLKDLTVTSMLGGNSLLVNRN